VNPAPASKKGEYADPASEIKMLRLLFVLSFGLKYKIKKCYILMRLRLQLRNKE
jgi:hypothetical protein